MVTKNTTYETEFGLSYETEFEALQSELNVKVNQVNKQTKQDVVDTLASYMADATLAEIGGIDVLEDVVDTLVFNGALSNVYFLLKNNIESVADIEISYGSEMSTSQRKKEENEVSEVQTEDYYNPTVYGNVPKEF